MENYYAVFILFVLLVIFLNYNYSNNSERIRKQHMINSRKC